MQTNNNHLSYFELTLLFFSGIVLLFIIAPILGIFLKTSGSDFFEAVQDIEVQSSVYITLMISLAGTVFSSVFAIPFAYFLARKNFPFKRIVSSIINIPVIIPHSAAGIAILGFISRYSVIGHLADTAGINLIGHPIAIAMAMAFVSLPFLINAARDGFSAVPVELEKAALTLGASPLRVFFTISVPLAFRAIMSGLVMMWARGLSEFGAVVIIAYHPMITPVLIFERFTSFGLKYARPVAAVFMIICLIIFILFRLLIDRKDCVTSKTNLH